MTDKYIERCSPSLIIRKMQIETIDTTSHLVGWLLPKKTISSVDNDVEKLEPSYSAVV